MFSFATESQIINFFDITYHLTAIGHAACLPTANHPGHLTDPEELSADQISNLNGFIIAIIFAVRQTGRNFADAIRTRPTSAGHAIWAATEKVDKKTIGTQSSIYSHLFLMGLREG